MSMRPWSLVNRLLMLNIFTILLLLVSCSDAPVQKNIDGVLFRNVMGAHQWSGRGQAEVSFKIPNFVSIGSESQMKLGAEHPNGILARVLIGDEWFSLIDVLLGADGIDPDYGELNDGYTVETAYTDIDGDGKSDILFGIGNKLSSLTFAVVTYNEKEKSLEILGGYDYAQEYVRIRKDTIEVPIGTQGLYSSFVYDPSRRVFANTENGDLMMRVEPDDESDDGEGDYYDEQEGDATDSRQHVTAFSSVSEASEWLLGSWYYESPVLPDVINVYQFSEGSFSKKQVRSNGAVLDSKYYYYIVCEYSGDQLKIAHMDERMDGRGYMCSVPSSIIRFVRIEADHMDMEGIPLTRM